MKIEDLPDYPALRQVQEALWGGKEARGAAVMIGAGFSRRALRTSENAPPPPLWRTFAATMLERLGPGGHAEDPLKLAEEYEAALGRNALDGLIRELVTDAQWRPSRAHERLLGLPWSDVLTTNWDTLLERTTPSDAERVYEWVQTPADIARTRSPRIVKLHGSLPSHTPFIFTSEDFRTYPAKFAPFVNLAQQVLLENELCLIGFSGDDPNFLQWAGWVRDHLGDTARKIRLIGVLGLSPSQRSVLLRRNVTPIDLAPLVAHLVDGDERQAAAVDYLLDAFWAARPAPRDEWKLAVLQRSDFLGNDADWLVRITETWQKERLDYRGWLVAPPDLRNRLERYTQDGLHKRWAAYDAAAPSVQAPYLVELVWRLQTALEALDPQVCQRIDALLTHHEALLSQADRLDLLRARLRDARLDFNWPDFDKAEAALAELAPKDPDLAYQRALKAWQLLDAPSLAAQTDLVRGDDPIWDVRRAGLLARLHQHRQAAELARTALHRIQDRRQRDRDSLWLLSREAWAAMAARAAKFELQAAGLDDPADDDGEEDRPSRYSGWKVNPWDHMHAFDRDLQDLIKRQRERDQIIRPRFDPGQYRDGSTTTWFASQTVNTLLRDWMALADQTGLSDTFLYTDMTGGRARRVLEEIRSPSEAELRWSAVLISSYNDGLIDVHFSRPAVARLSADLVKDLAARLRDRIEYDLSRADGEMRAISAIRVRIELLSRLVLRLSPSEVAEHLSWGLALMRDARLKDWWLFEVLEHLLRRAYQATPPDQRRAFTLAILEAPLAGERGLTLERSWPLPADFLTSNAIVRPAGNPAWSRRVSDLMDCARQPVMRRDALQVLFDLCLAEALTSVERARLGEIVWSSEPDLDSPGSRFLPHAYLLFPDVTPPKAQAFFDKAVIAPLVQGALSEYTLAGLQGAGHHPRINLSLARQDAIAIFDHLLEWRPAPERSAYDLGRVRQHNLAMRAAIAGALAFAVLPAMDGDLDEGRSEKLLAAISRSDDTAFLEVAAELVALRPTSSDLVFDALRRALNTRQKEVASCALTAIYHAIDRLGVDLQLPSGLVRDVVELGVRQAAATQAFALDVLRKLCVSEHLSPDDIKRICEGLEALQVETDYADWDDRDPRTHILTMIRANCVRLAKALQDTGVDAPIISAWLDIANNDPAPEVCFALSRSDLDDE